MSMVVWYVQGQVVQPKDFDEAKEPVMPKNKAIVLKSFADLGSHFKASKGHHFLKKKNKPTPSAMLVSVTTWVDATLIRKSGDIRFMRKNENNTKWIGVTVGKKLARKYITGNSDGTMTITGRYAINKIVVPLVR